MDHLTDDYARRIIASNPLELVVINYELLIQYVEKAQKNVVDGIVENVEDFKKNITKAQSFLEELIVSLNLEYEMSHDLKTIYLYVSRLLIESLTISESKQSKLEEAIGILNALLEGFQTVEKENTLAPPVLENASKLFAGLTYGAGGSLQEYVEENRGYRA